MMEPDPLSSAARSVRVLFSCTGIGLENRGIESFFRDAFDGLKHARGLEARMIRSETGCVQNEAGDSECPVWCLPRKGKLAPLIGSLTGRSGYAVEQWSSFPGVVREIRKFRPDVVFTSEANLMFLLRRFRRQIGVPFRVLYSNGGPVHPPFDRHDVVHQVAPLYYEEAVASGEPSGKHFLVPYGIDVSASSIPSHDEQIRLREVLGLPKDRTIILSVGWISKQHKRMDYTIREVARLPEPRPFLQLLGAMDEGSAEVIALGKELLGEDGFDAASVPYERVFPYYKAADIFVLASLKEGFGRVYLEALMHGLPTIGHNHPVISYVLGDAGICTDLSVESGLAGALSGAIREIGRSDQSVLACARRQSVTERFGWDALRHDYVKMFRTAAQGGAI